MTLKVDGITELVNNGLHNAFTDLCGFRGAYYLTYRACPDGHMIFNTSQIIVMKSIDRVNWTEVQRFSVPDRDVRDPHFLVFAGRLSVYSGTWPVFPGDPNGRDMDNHRGYGSWTTDGETWQDPFFMEGTLGYYIWRPGSWGGHAYLLGRKRSANGDGSTEGWLLRSDDGETWEPFVRLPGPGNEAAFVFGADGSMTALCRGAGTDAAALCYAAPPFRDWSRIELDRQVGGPLLARWGERLLAGGRHTAADGERTTRLYWVVGQGLQEAARLPSGGDNSYPGFVATDEHEGWLSYYSSHQGSRTNLAPSSIYLARLRLS